MGLMGLSNVNAVHYRSCRHGENLGSLGGLDLYGDVQLTYLLCTLDAIRTVLCTIYLLGFPVGLTAIASTIVTVIEDDTSVL